MIILLTILCVICGFIALADDDVAGILTTTGLAIFGVFEIIAIIACIICYSEGFTAKDKIKMYEEENVKIEEQMDALVKRYMEYEGETFKEFKTDSSVTLVSMYPELKSDELIKAQINTYIANNNKIKELKEAAIDLKIGKWLLYFGG